MGAHGASGACPSAVGSMHLIGVTVGFCAVFLCGLLIWRGAENGAFKLFPLFFSYVIYIFLGSLSLYLIYWRAPQRYPSAYWIYYLISILVEFTVLVEISDQIFRAYPAIRRLGRGLTLLISAGFGIFYILPTIVWSPGRSPALLGFSLRAFETKAIILTVLFYVARHFRSILGRNVGGLMLGFSIYMALNIALMASAKFFGSAIYAQTLWVMEPVSFFLCMSVWTLSLWNVASLPTLGTLSNTAGSDAGIVALELVRFNSEISKIVHK